MVQRWQKLPSRCILFVPPRPHTHTHTYIYTVPKELFFEFKGLWTLYILTGLPHSSVGKESACNAGDPDSIPGSGRSAGGGIGYPLQYSWASLVAQLVKNLPAVQETWV